MLVAPPGRVVGHTMAALTVRVDRTGSVLVRVRWSRLLAASPATRCTLRGPTPDGFTTLVTTGAAICTLGGR